MNLNKLYNSKNGRLKFWYFNTYKNLGYSWLCETINLLFNGKTNINIISPCANEGFYEYETCKILNNTNFYLCDKVAEDINHVNSCLDKRFVYNNKNIDVFEINSNKELKEKFDVVLDIKGALWYALFKKKYRKRNLIKILSNYIFLLKDDKSYLVIDNYYTNFLKHIINCIEWSIKGYNRKFNRVKCFGERSTGFKFQKYLKLIGSPCITINNFNKEKLFEFPLLNKMGVMCIKKKDLQLLIDKLK